LLKEQGGAAAQVAPDAYAIVPDVSTSPAVMVCLEALRANGVSVLMHAGSGDSGASMKSQFKRADQSGARFALVFGQDEMANGLVTVKTLRDGTGAQSTQRLDEVAHWAKSLQFNA
jgi:histidyl-tRNA synthetase